ncbi:MAG: hypothetical protein Q7J51_01305 [Sheuella sp.]|nr:hypothetical protein [Sheuella sp.]
MQLFHTKSCRISWVQLAVIVIFTCVMGYSSYQTLRDPDTYLHLAAGKWIISHQQLPQTDPFSYVMQGSEWLTHEWLSEIFLSLIYQYGGWSALVILAALCLAVTTGIELRFLFNRVPAIYALSFSALTFFSLVTHLSVRPHILVWPLIGIWFAKILETSEQNKAPPYWLLLLMLCWANLHGSFILGFVLLIPIAIEATLKQPHLLFAWSRFGLLAVMTSMITPLGLKGWLFSFQLMNLQALTSISEWAASDFTALNPIELWLVILLAYGLLGKLRLEPLRLILLLLVLHQALAHGRYISLFGLLTPMLIASSLQASQRHTNQQSKAENLLDHWFSRLSFKGSPLGTGMTILLLIFTGLFFTHYKSYYPDHTITPQKAVAAIKQSQIKGNVLNFYNFGGYLIDQGIPVFVDGRADLYGDPHLKTYMEGTQSNHPEKIQKLLNDFNIAWTIFPPGSALNLYLEGSEHWKLFYQDAIATVYVRSAN